MALTCWAVAAHAAGTGSRLVVLRGNADGKEPLTFVADESTLADASLGGVSGAELLALKGQRLLAQAELYRSAQRSAGTTVPSPLYVVLDPSGTWAYASPWGTFRYTRGGETVGPVTTPFLKLGEAMDLQGQSVDPGEESAAANRKLVEQAKAFYETELKKKGVKKMPDFEKDVLDRLTVWTGTKQTGLSKALDTVPTDRFLGYLQRVVESDLLAHGIDGRARWSVFVTEAGADATVAEAKRAMLKRGVAETVAHELGHVIQFAALGLYNYKGAALGVHMMSNTHSLQTLSTPEFALVEGWGEANSMVVVGLPKERAPGEANRINYAASASGSTETLNDRVGRLVSARLHKDGLLKPAEALTTPPLTNDPEQFRAGLKDVAIKAGLSAADWDALSAEIDRDPTYRDMVKARDYIKGLQAREGQLRSRYDFLRSEYAVANTLARLREAMGPEAAKEVCETLARRRPRDLAALIENFVHDHPARRLETYRVLATATEGILVTPAQVAAIEEADRGGRALEIDFDQDGSVPGTSANTALAAVFPRDMPAPGEEPLPYARDRNATPAAPTADASAPVTAAPAEDFQLAPPRGERTIPNAVEPEMNGIERP